MTAEEYRQMREAPPKPRNLSAGTTIQIPARKVVTFKPSKDFNTNQDK